jgi:hypothetical protein
MKDVKRISKIESVMLGMFFGFGPLVFCLITSVLSVGILFGTKVLGPWMLLSLVPGVIIDVIFLRRWVRNAYQMNTKILAGIYFFYSVVGIGMGMGVPLFNFILVIMAGIYIARRMHYAGADEETRRGAFKKTAVFCAAVMVFICCLITLWAILGQMIGYRVETPFVSFTFTVPVFSAFVLTGGALLVLSHYWLTRAAAKVIVRLSRPRARAKD